jgi:UDP-glucose 4-epimerase
MPLAYYEEINVGGTLALLAAMRAAGVGTLVFSSSATVYGQPGQLPIAEDAALAPGSVYGRTKRVAEDALRDLARAEPASLAILRYFNPAGAVRAGPSARRRWGRPENLVPLLCRVAGGELPHLPVLGTDWPTPDGTGVRDSSTCRTSRPATCSRSVILRATRASPR